FRPDPLKDCSVCPLYKEFCVDCPTHPSYDTTIMGLMEEEWLANNKTEFEILRKKMVEEMESCRHMFEVGE
ncbi:MAG: hypothetical protein ACTSRU_20440, partial [Candidatus Hodarchaeales archaeon]